MSNKREEIYNTYMKQLDFNSEKAIQESPFKLPEGYFENFTANLMKQIPQQETGIHAQTNKMPAKTILRRLRPIFYAAAMVTGLAFGITTYSHHSSKIESPERVTAQATSNLNTQDATTYVNEFCDFALIDEQDIYACVNNNSSY